MKRAKNIEGLIAKLIVKVKQGYPCKDAMRVLSEVGGKESVNQFKKIIRYEIKRNLALQNG